MSSKTNVFDKKTKSTIKQAFTNESRPTVLQDSIFFTHNPKFYGSAITNQVNSLTYVHTLGQVEPPHQHVENQILDKVLEKNQINDNLEGLSRKNLVKKARSKYHTLELIEQLISLESENKITYLRAQECSNLLKQEQNFLKSTYCKTRNCIICNNIRTAQFINRFEKPISDLGKTHFTTVSPKNVTWQELEKTIQIMLDAFAKIKQSIKLHYTIIDNPFSGIRRLEITYNPEEDTYHPHIHILHNPGYQNLIIKKWLELFPTAHIKGQHTRETDQNTLLETFKYSFKVIQGTKEKPEIYVSALDKIISSTRGKRLVQPFGKLYNIKCDDNDLFDLNRQSFHDLPKNHFDKWYWNEIDWANTGSTNPENLTGYQPSDFKPNYII
jgi:hypothetical protein